MRNSVIHGIDEILRNPHGERLSSCAFVGRAGTTTATAAAKEKQNCEKSVKSQTFHKLVKVLL